MSRNPTFRSQALIQISEISLLQAITYKEDGAFIVWFSASRIFSETRLRAVQLSLSSEKVFSYQSKTNVSVGIRKPAVLSPELATRPAR
jgi:hypothetical protein